MLVFALLFFSVTLLLYAYIRWSYCKEFTLAGKIGGPYAYPIIGNALLMMSRSSLVFLDVLKRECEHLKWFRLWLGPFLIVFITDPEDIQTVSSNKGAIDKGLIYKITEPIFNNGLIASNTEVWQYNRKVVAPTFNTIRLKHYATIFTREHEKLARSWKGKIGKKFSPYKESIGIFAAIPLLTAMGDKVFNQVTQNIELFSLAYEIRQLSDIVSKRGWNVFHHPDCIFKLTAEYKRLEKLLGILDNFLEEIIRAKREENEDDNSFLSYAIKAEKSYSNFRHKELIDELKTYITAGSATSSSMSSFVVIMLGIFPEIQEKVFKEQMDILGAIDKEPTFDDLSKMVYLEQVMKETLRIFPTIPIIGRQLSEDIKLGDKILPKGCIVAFPPYIVQRMEEYYPNPLVFNPDRFLPEEEKKRHPYTFIPFGGAIRTCIGQRYAMYSIKAYISAIIRRYKIHADYELDYILKNLKASVELVVDEYEISISER